MMTSVTAIATPPTAFPAGSMRAPTGGLVWGASVLDSTPVAHLLTLAMAFGARSLSSCTCWDIGFESRIPSPVADPAPSARTATTAAPLGIHRDRKDTGNERTRPKRTP